MDIAIIGGGLSGTLLAYYLLQEDRHPVTVYLFEKDYQQLSRGIAYRASNESQLLNVSAINMNLYGLPVGDFYHWLQSHGHKNILPGDFVSRALFGTYLKKLFQESLDQAKNVKVKVITDEVIDIIKDEDGLHVSTANGHTYYVAKAVVANGILPPADPFEVTLDIKFTGLYQSNPWNFHYLDQLRNDDLVVLIGTGLTMLDHAAGLLKKYKSIQVTAFSRRGLLPLAHKPHGSYDFPDYSIIPNEDIGELFQSIRAYYLAHTDKGLDWRDLIDRVRSQVPQLWKALSASSKKRFIRHLKPYWEIHRHRAPQEVLSVVQHAIHEGRFKLLKGKIREVASNGQCLFVTLVNPEGVMRIKANYLLNSSGLQHNISLTSDPLLKKLLERGYMVPDLNKLGVETDEFGAFQCTVGERNIFTVGALRRAAVFECTAAKEIGEQAFLLSKNLMDFKIA
jgi:uncharacterized NAD(P)/FAD-binding protein YdhS